MFMKCKVTVDTSHYPKEGPWELPEGWCWTTIDDIAFVTKLAGFEYTEFIANNLTGSDGVPLFKGKNVQDGKIIYKFESYIPKAVSDELPRSQVRRKCLLTPYVGTIGNIGIHDKGGFYHLGSNVGKIEILNGYQTDIYEEYVKIFLQSSAGYKELTKQKKATAQDSISIEAIREVFIPIPPRREQQLILLQLNHWLSVVDSIKHAEDGITETICTAKAEILDLAIHGKLVPQDSSDEPAIELLKRINPDLKPSDNLHYDEALPSGWAITPLYIICDTITGLWKGKKEPLINVGVIRNANFTKDFTLDYSKIEYIDVEQKSFEKRNLENGDIIVEKSGGSDNFPVGRSILYRGENGKYSFSNFTMSLRIAKKDCILPEYLYYVLQYRYRRGDMKQLQTQTTGLHNLLTDKFMSLTIPIPPVEEQLRIVQTIKNLFGIVNGIRDLVNDNKQGINSL